MVWYSVRLNRSIFMTFVRFSKLVFCLVTVLNVNHLSSAVAVPDHAHALDRVTLKGFSCGSSGSDCSIGKGDMEFAFSGFVRMKMYEGDVDWIRDFVKHNGVEWRDAHGQTLLYYAVLSEKKDLVKLVIEEFKCPLRVFDDIGNSPLDYSNGEIFDYLMDKCLSLVLDSANKWVSNNWFSDQELLRVACRHASDKFIRILTVSPYNTTIELEMFEKLSVAYWRSIEEDEALKATKEYFLRKYEEQQARRPFGGCNFL